jgi:hypothetical protein
MKKLIFIFILCSFVFANDYVVIKSTSKPETEQVEIVYKTGDFDTYHIVHGSALFFSSKFNHYKLINFDLKTKKDTSIIIDKGHLMFLEYYLVNK